MYIVITNIDAVTGKLCTEEPMVNGPSLPAINGFSYIFSNESIYPIATSESGTYLEMPLYYGTCDDDVNPSIIGVVKVLTEEEFIAAKEAEHLARRPYPSWVGDINTMSWFPPVDYPAVPQYRWDEATASWVQV
jgi:hypothetical protein